MDDGLALVAEIAGGLLQLGGISAPPVDPQFIARKKGYLLRHRTMARGQTSVAKPLRDGRWEICIDKRERDERRSFALAHEIMEIELSKALPLMSLDARHRLALRGASLLLMPDQWFAEAALSAGYELLALKPIFKNVSFEALAYRLIDFVPGVVTVLDNGIIKSRVRSFGLEYRRGALIDIERKVFELACLRSGRASLSEDGVSVNGYALEEEQGWRRVILITMPET